jgi:hypothetical protein
MQGFRKYALAVSLSTVVVLGTVAPTPARWPANSLDGSVITEILEFFGIELQSRISVGPG